MSVPGDHKSSKSEISQLMHCLSNGKLICFEIGLFITSERCVIRALYAI